MDSYYFRVTFLTRKKTSCMMTNHPLNMLQQHLTKVMLQDVSQLINIFRTRILFYHAFFNTDLFLKYKETMGTL